MRVFRSKILVQATLFFLILSACSRKDQDAGKPGLEILQFSLVPGSDNTEINSANHQVTVHVPDSLYYGIKLKAVFKLSPGSTAQVNGLEQVSGVTVNDFEQDIHYTVFANDHRTRQDWTVQASNNMYSVSWGLGHFINRSLSEDRSYSWYIDQGTSGNFAGNNCGPSSVTMAIRWADSGFNKTAADARQTYQTDGGWWYTTDITSYLNLYGVEFGIISLGAEPADFAGRVKSQLDRNQIIILCLDMDRVRQSGVDQYRADKFYATSPGWGHFIVLKGYRQVDQELFFEAYDPYSFGKTNTDHTLKGEDRYYRFEDLAAATQNWWNYAFVIARKGMPLSTEAKKMSLDPGQVPAAHNY